MADVKNIIHDQLKVIQQTIEVNLSLLKYYQAQSLTKFQERLEVVILKSNIKSYLDKFH